MTLAQYLKQSGETMAAFGARVRCSHATISRLVNGKILPSAHLAARIELATDHQVRLLDFAGLELGGQTRTQNSEAA